MARLYVTYAIQTKIGLLYRPTRAKTNTNTPCPGKKEASSFSTISLAFLDRFS